jgi:uncharacterized protein YlxW (UPF0749 family)
VRRSWGWRIGTPAVILASGALFVVSGVNSDGTDLRPGRYTDLPGLVSAEAGQTQQLTNRVAQLQSQIDQLTNAVPDSEVKAYQRRIDALKGSAGLTEERGAGVQITLSDAPEANLQNSPLDANAYVVHQQDIQAVVNALWRGGATAITLQGQRIVTTTGIKCSGSTVTLQGVPYPEPFVIQAVGDQGALQTALDADSYVRIYRQQSADPRIGIGWSESYESDVVAPAYAGLRDVTYAQPETKDSSAG